MMGLDELKKEAKYYIDCNVWDGEDRIGCESSATFTSDEMQELIYDLLEYLIDE